MKISTDEDPSLRVESSAIINLRGVSTKLNKYIVFTMQTYKKLSTLLFIYSKGALCIDYGSIWCHDFTIICIAKKLEVKILAYASFISDFPTSYRAEKLVYIT